MKQTVRKWVLVGLTSACILLSLQMTSTKVSASTARGQVVGYVQEVVGDATGYQVERDGERVFVSVFTQIQSGDKIIVSTAEHSITVRFANQKTLVVTQDTSPVVIAANSAKTSIKSNVLTWVKRYLDNLKAVEQLETVSLSTRGGALQPWPPNILLTHPGDANFIAAGERSLHLEWVNGIPPFSLRLQAIADDGVVLSAANVTNSFFVDCLVSASTPLTSQQYQVFRYTTAELGLAEGSYRLFVGDALGNVAVRNFVVNSEIVDRLFEARQLIGDVSTTQSDSQVVLDSLLCEAIGRG